MTAVAAARPDRVRPIHRVLRRMGERGAITTVRKAFADHVFRYSVSVIVEFQRGWGAVGDARVHPDWLTFRMARARSEMPPLGDWLAARAGAFAAMLDAGKVGIFALDDGVAVGCAWLALSDHDDPASREHYEVRTREAYHYCWLVDPGSRRRNVTLPLCRHILAVFDTLDIDRAFGVVDRVNRASYLVQRHFGYRERGVKVIHAHILGRRMTWTARYRGVLGTADPADRAMPRA